MLCSDCQNTGYITTFTTRKRCARCLAAKADEFINSVLSMRQPVIIISARRPGGTPKIGSPFPVVDPVGICPVARRAELHRLGCLSPQSPNSRRQLREWSSLRPGVSVAEVLRQLDTTPTWDEAGNLIKGDPETYFGVSGYIVPTIYP